MSYIRRYLTFNFKIESVKKYILHRSITPMENFIEFIRDIDSLDLSDYIINEYRCDISSMIPQESRDPSLGIHISMVGDYSLPDELTRSMLID